MKYINYINLILRVQLFFASNIFQLFFKILHKKKEYFLKCNRTIQPCNLFGAREIRTLAPLPPTDRTPSYCHDISFAGNLLNSSDTTHHPFRKTHYVVQQ